MAGVDSGPESLRMSVTETNRIGWRRRIETVNRRLRLVRHVRRTEAGLRAALAGRPECAANEGDRLLRRGYGAGIEVGIPLCGYGGDGQYRAKPTTVRQNTETLLASATASTDDGTVAPEGRVGGVVAEPLPPQNRTCGHCRIRFLACRVRSGTSTPLIRRHRGRQPFWRLYGYPPPLR